jgi:serine/threonine protein kinase
MCYLESNHVLHRDLACRNVLIAKESDGKFLAKISDFGLSRSSDLYQTAEKTMPVKWTAIESLKFGTFTSKSDVWSFGVLLWELFSFGTIPYAGKSNASVIEEVAAGYRLPSPENCPEEVYQLMVKCWNADPNERPSFKEMAELVEKWNDIENTTSIMVNVVVADTAEYN